MGRPWGIIKGGKDKWEQARKSVHRRKVWPSLVPLELSEFAISRLRQRIAVIRADRKSRNNFQSKLHFFGPCT